jgi:methionyl-tRNA formyltransferase
MNRLLFLGYDRSQTRIIQSIEDRGWIVDQTSDIVDSFDNYEIVVSFGYRHIMSGRLLNTSRHPVLNLHIGYLPWNRGAHPLFWAAYDGTPVGVTIHEVDTGVDTGHICFQRKLSIDFNSETFEGAYRRLVNDIEDLFEENIESILFQNYESIPQNGKGSSKRLRDLPGGFHWSDTIAPTIERLRKSGGNS